MINKKSSNFFYISILNRPFKSATLNAAPGVWKTLPMVFQHCKLPENIIDCCMIMTLYNLHLSLRSVSLSLGWCPSSTSGGQRSKSDTGGTVRCWECWSRVQTQGLCKDMKIWHHLKLELSTSIFDWKMDKHCPLHMTKRRPNSNDFEFFIDIDDDWRRWAMRPQSRNFKYCTMGSSTWTNLYSQRPNFLPNLQLNIRFCIPHLQFLIIPPTYLRIRVPCAGTVHILVGLLLVKIKITVFSIQYI